MLGIHSYWPAPWLAKHKKTENDDVHISYDVLLTWLVSAVSWKINMGPIRLYTDNKGCKFIEKYKLHWLYNAGIDTRLSDISLPVDKAKFANIFWAAGKIWALQLCREVPCCQIDTDAIIWSPFSRNDEDMIYLHDEDKTHSTYKKNRTQFSNLIPKIFDRDDIWAAQIQNTGVMGFYDDVLKDYFTNQSIEFMVKYIIDNVNNDKLKDTGQMCFAEQRLLPMTCTLLNKKSHAMGTMLNGHLKRNRIVTHLWNSKRIYEYSFDAMEFYCNYLIAYLRKHEPKLSELCDKIEINMSKIKVEYAAKFTKQREFFSNSCAKIKNLDGEVILWEPNLPTFRVAKEGTYILPWEEIQCLKGKFDLYSKTGKLISTYQYTGEEKSIDSIDMGPV